MRIVDRYRDLIAPQVARRAERYFTERRVTNVHVEAGGVIRATVVGTLDYDVRIRVDPSGNATTTCTCEASDTFSGVCKHVYALMLEAQRIGLLARQGAARAPRPVSWRDLAHDPETRPPEGDVRYRVHISKKSYAPVSIEATIARAKGGYRTITLREASNARPSDRPLVDLLFEESYGPVPRAPIPLSEERIAFVLPLVASTKRASIVIDEGEETPLDYDDGPPYAFALSTEPRDGGLLVRGAFVRGDERVPLGEVRALLRQGLIVIGSTLARAKLPHSFRWVTTLRERAELVVAPDEIDDFIEFAMRAPFEVELPSSLRYEHISVAPSLVVCVTNPTPRGAQANAFFEYDGHRAAGSKPAMDRATRRVWTRDAAAEAQWLESLRALGFRTIEDGMTIATARLPSAVRELVKMGVRVEGERGAIFRSATAFSSRVSSGIDWFDLEAAAHFGTESVALPALLAAARRGDTTVVLGDGSLALLPEEWLAQFGIYGELGTREGDAIRFRRSQAALIDGLIDAQPDIAVDLAAKKLRDALVRAPKARKPSRSFRGELRPYQSEGLGWLSWLAENGLGGCLADDMGLGKTVQVLALLAGRRAKKTSLVVLPRSLIFNWKNEAERFAPSLRVTTHVGTERDVSSLTQADLVLTTYGTLRRDIEELAKIHFDYAILDEAQAIKNHQSQSAKAARLLVADHRLAMTGTPVENHARELGSLFAFVEPGLLDARSIERMAEKRAAPDVRRALARLLKPFVLRRTKGEVARELPDRVEQTRFVELDRAERLRYDELREYYRRLLLGGNADPSTMNVLEALLRLRQAACHPSLIDKSRIAEPSAKVDTLVAELEEVTTAGHKAIVFSQFTSLLAVVRNRLDALGLAYEYLDGQTRDREACVTRFQRDDGARVFLISLKAGGVGLNLTAAEYVFLLDPWWNPAVEAQAIDRAHRIGQTRTVMAYRLIAKDTVEERVLALQNEKRELFESLFGDGAAVGAITSADLALLLS